LKEDGFAMKQKEIALLLLLVFALAITPKQLLHDAIATHQHHLSLPSPEARVNKASFLCDCDNLVAEGSFTEPANAFLIHPDFVYGVFSSHPHSYYELLDIHGFRLRGPPSL
jgi:hypothetical protein